jgi:hypothetical protein
MVSGPLLFPPPPGSWHSTPDSIMCVGDDGEVSTTTTADCLMHLYRFFHAFQAIFPPSSTVSLTTCSVRTYTSIKYMYICTVYQYFAVCGRRSWRLSGAVLKNLCRDCVCTHLPPFSDHFSSNASSTSKFAAFRATMITFSGSTPVGLLMYDVTIYTVVDITAITAVVTSLSVKMFLFSRQFAPFLPFCSILNIFDSFSGAHC